MKKTENASGGRAKEHGRDIEVRPLRVQRYEEKARGESEMRKKTRRAKNSA